MHKKIQGFNSTIVASIVINIVLCVVSFTYDIYIFGITLWNIRQIFLFLMLLSMFGSLLKKVLKEKGLGKYCALFTVLLIIFLIIQSADFVRSFLYDKEIYYEFHLKDESVYVVKEYRNMSGTHAILYRKNGWILKEIQSGIYNAEPGFYPAQSGNFEIKTIENNQMVFWYKPAAESNYSEGCVWLR